MKRTCYKALIFWALMFGILISFRKECRASETVSISSNTIVKDCLENGNDTNCYSYTMDTAGYFYVEFSSMEPVSDAGWNMYICDETGKELCSYVQFKGSVTTQKFNFIPGKKLLIKVCSADEKDALQRRGYTVAVKTVATGNWETETGRSATDIWADRIRNVSELTSEKRYGSLWTGTDNDVYMLRVSGTGTVTLCFWPNNLPENIGWGYDIEIYRSDGTKAIGYKQIKTPVRKIFYAKQGVYYAVIKANWSKVAPPATDDYAIAAMYKNSAVPSMQGKKISVISKRTVLKWTKAKQVDGYEIRFCKNRKFKKKQTKVYTTTENTYKVPKRFRKRTYYVRIRAYCETVTGERVYGKFGKIKRINKKSK